MDNYFKSLQTSKNQRSNEKLNPRGRLNCTYNRCNGPEMAGVSANFVRMSLNKRNYSYDVHFLCRFPRHKLKCCIILIKTEVIFNSENYNYFFN